MNDRITRVACAGVSLALIWVAVGARPRRSSRPGAEPPAPRRTGYDDVWVLAEPPAGR